MANVFTKFVRRVTGLTGSASWSDDAFKTDGGKFDKFNERMLRYYIAERYYMNDVYSGLNLFAGTLKARMNLYRHVRGIYNPAERLVEGTVAMMYGGRLNLTDLTDGAIPIITENPAEREAITDLFRRSKMKREKNRYARDASKFGDGVLKVVDDGDEGAYIEAVDPRKVCHIHKDSRDRIDYALIGWIEYDENDTAVYVTEELTSTEINVYRDASRPDYDRFVGGNRIEAESYPNPYGFVPLTHAPFRDNNNVFGLNAFWSQRFKIDEINDVASILHDNFRNALEQLYFAKGITKGSLSTNRDDTSTRDMIRIIYGNPNADLTPLLKTVDVPGGMATIQEMQKELAADLPVLSLHTLRDMTEVSAPGVRAAYSDAISRIEETQSNLDDALETAIAMALAIEGYRGRLPGFNLPYYTGNEWEFYIGDRVIIHDDMSDMEVVQALNLITPDSPTTPLALKRMGFSQDEIDEVTESAGSIRQGTLRQSILSAQAGNLSALQRAGAGIRNGRDDTPAAPSEPPPDENENRPI